MSTPQLAAERLAEHVVATRFEHLPAEVVDKAKIFLLDTLGVGVAGSRAPFAAELKATVAGWGAGDEVGVWADRLRLPAASAALVNAFQIHNQEFDAVHEPAVVHAMTVPTAAALAFAARRRGASVPLAGRDLVTALAVAVDVAASLGVAARSGLRFFRPGTAGAFGAVAAIAKLAGFEAAKLIDAWGIVYGQIGGTMQAHVEGKPLLPLQIGFCARAALNAIDLAMVGLDGPRDVFEGTYGYFRLFEGEWDLAPVWRELGRRWRIAELSHKPFPTGRASHGGIDGLQQLVARHGFTAADVDRVRVIAPPLIEQLVGRPDDPDAPVNYARLCMAHVGAAALVRGTVTLDDFAPSRFYDTTVRTLARRIVVETDGNPDPNALNPQRVEVLLKDGTRHAIDVPVPLGNPARPLTRDQHLAKFRACWRYAGMPPETCDAVIALVDRLENLTNIDALIALTTL